MGIPNPPAVGTRGSPRECNHPLSNSSASKTSKMETRTDEASLASRQSTGSNCTSKRTKVKPPDPQATFPLEKGSMGRKDKSTDLRNTRTPSHSRPNGVVKRLAKGCHHVLCGLPSHVAPCCTRISSVCRRGKGRHDACGKRCETWVVHLMINQYHASGI